MGVSRAFVAVFVVALLFACERRAPAPTPRAISIAATEVALPVTEAHHLKTELPSPILERIVVSVERSGLPPEKTGGVRALLSRGPDFGFSSAPDESDPTRRRTWNPSIGGHSSVRISGALELPRVSWEIGSHTNRETPDGFEWDASLRYRVEGFGVFRVEITVSVEFGDYPAVPRWGSTWRGPFVEDGSASETTTTPSRPEEGA